MGALPISHSARNLKGTWASRNVALWALCATMLGGLVALILFPKWTVDDAYITFRYADNLATFGELNWNVGEDPVEGYTGVAWPVILAATSKLHLPLVTASQILGAIATAVTTLLLWLIVRTVVANRLAAVIPAALFVATPIVYTHAFSGLETMLFTMAVMAVFYSFLLALNRISAPGHGLYEILLLASLLLAALVRPEGAVLGSLIVATYVVAHRLHRSNPTGFLIRATLFLVVPSLTYFVWRWQYYGELLPNTFYAKNLSSATLVHLPGFLLFVGLYVCLPLLAASLPVWYRHPRWLIALIPGLIRSLGARSFRPHVIAAVGVGVVAFSWHPSRKLPVILTAIFLVGALAVHYLMTHAADLRKESVTQAIRPPFIMAYAACSVWVLLIMYGYMFSSLDMNYSFRFFFSFLPLFLLGLAVVIDMAILSAQRLSRRSAPVWILGGACGVLIVGQVVLSGTLFIQQWRFVTAQEEKLQDEHVAIGRYLKQNVPSEEWLAVYWDAGAVPYFSGLRTIDLRGLNDEFIGRNFTRLSPRQIGDYVASKRPGVLVISSTQWDSIAPDPILEAILSQGNPGGGYTLVAKYRTNARPHLDQYQFVYSRDDLVPLMSPHLLDRGTTALLSN